MSIYELFCIIKEFKTTRFGVYNSNTNNSERRFTHESASIYVKSTPTYTDIP